MWFWVTTPQVAVRPPHQIKSRSVIVIINFKLTLNIMPSKHCKLDLPWSVSQSFPNQYSCRSPVTKVLWLCCIFVLRFQQIWVVPAGHAGPLLLALLRSGAWRDSAGFYSCKPGSRRDNQSNHRSLHLSLIIIGRSKDAMVKFLPLSQNATSL